MKIRGYDISYDAKSRKRARIEHVFGARRAVRIVRTIGMVRTRAKIGLQTWPTTFAAW